MRSRKEHRGWRSDHWPVIGFYGSSVVSLMIILLGLVVRNQWGWELFGLGSLLFTVSLAAYLLPKHPLRQREGLLKVLWSLPLATFVVTVIATLLLEEPGTSQFFSTAAEIIPVILLVEVIEARAVMTFWRERLPIGLVLRNISLLLAGEYFALRALVTPPNLSRLRFSVPGEGTLRLDLSSTELSFAAGALAAGGMALLVLALIANLPIGSGNRVQSDFH